MCFLLRNGLFVSHGGWGDGKKKARGERWASFRCGGPCGGESSPCHFQARRDEHHLRLFSFKFFTQSKVKNISKIQLVVHYQRCVLIG